MSPPVATIVYDPPLREGILLRRYQRFLADVELTDGTRVTAHVPNTGAMTGCNAPGSRCWVSPATNPRRKLAWTLEIVDAGPALVAVHTGRANQVARRLLEGRAIPELATWDRVRREVPLGGSRLDFLLEREGGRPCAVEVKSVTLAEGPLGLFPDAITARGTRHLELLARLAREGRMDTALLYAVLREDARAVAPAERIDPAYAEALRAAAAAGVTLLARGCRVTPREIVPTGPLPVRVDP